MNLAFWVSYVLLWGLVVVMGLAFLEAVRQIAQLRAVGEFQAVPTVLTAGHAHGALVGQVLLDADGVREWSLADHVARHGVRALLFLSTTCPTCRDIARDHVARQPGPAVLPVVTGDAEACRRFVAEVGLARGPVGIDAGDRLARHLGVTWRPVVVAVEGDGIGPTAGVGNLRQVDEFVRRLVERPAAVAAPGGPPPGDHAPHGHAVRASREEVDRVG